MTKREARALAKARRAELDMQAVGCGMARALFALPCWAAADTVLAFAAMPDEPDTAAILRQALADGKRLLLPRVRSRTEMDWVEIPSLSLLQPGVYGIPEPPADLPAADPGGDAATLALIPCLAAGTDGVRLGRGGGYYDRFLAQYKGERLLLCPAAALLADLPADDWDARFAPDEILTEKGIFTMKKLLFATALLTSLFLSACGSQKADSNDLANQPATRPEEGAELDPEFSVDDEDTGETAEPQPDAELSGMVDAIYQLQPVEAMGIETVAVDLTDESWYGYLAGLTADNVGKVDAAVVSEPMTGSQAYSLVLLRLKDKADAREIANSMEENISMRKWVCVEADKARVVSFDDKLLYVMADSELVDVDLLADAAAKAFDATFDVDDSLVNEDESELPPELLSAPAVAD